MSNLTDNELSMIKAFIAESVYSCGDFHEDENMSWMSASDLMKKLGWGHQKVGGVMSSIEKKGLIYDSGDSARGLENDWVADVELCTEHPQLADYIAELLAS